MIPILKNHDYTKVIGNMDEKGIVTLKDPILLDDCVNLEYGISILESQDICDGMYMVKKFKIVCLSFSLGDKKNIKIITEKEG